MSKLANTVSESAINTAAPPVKPRCLFLQVEPTTYILHRLEEFNQKQDFHSDIRFVTANHSQPWNLKQDVGEVLLDPGVSAWTRFRRVASLTRLILSRSFSVAFLAGWGSFLLVYFSLVLKLSGTPFCFDSDTQLAEPREAWKEKIKSLIYPVYLKAAAGVFPAGKRQAEFFRTYNVEPRRIHVSHMTVDIKRIRELPILPRNGFLRSQGVDPSDVVFIFVGRLEAFKGITSLLRAFEIVVARHPGCTLVIVGDGALRKEVEGSATRNLKVRYQGRQGFDTVMQWMRSSDALVLPSQVEPWGLVVNEAMACGLPLIVSDRVGAADDLVENGRNGFVIKSGDTDGLADAMLRIATDPLLRRRMSQASVEMIDPWTLEAEVETMRRVLLSVSR